MTTKNKTCSRTWVTFIIHGENLDPSDVSNLINLEPTYFFKKGELYGDPESPKVRKQGHWEIESKTNVNSKDLTRHIEWILDKIESKKKRIMEIMTKYYDSTGYLSCFWELKENELHGGPILDSKLLKRIADMNLELSVDFYS